MRDKANATVFIRKIDRSHPKNIRVVMPQFIDKFLKNPERIVFSINNGFVVIEPINKLQKYKY